MPLQTIVLIRCQAIPSRLRRYYRYLSYKMEEAIMKFWIPETCPSLISCIMILPYKYFLLSKSQMTVVTEQTYYQRKTDQIIPASQIRSECIFLRGLRYSQISSVFPSTDIHLEITWYN